MAKETIVTAALTGGHMNFQNHPNFPITPEQIAREAIEARQAGAAVAHIHVREPDGSRSGNPAYFREVV
ncbi:MAG: 3-keto-5-aminohexanoate cleavage protein, partial [Alphaproteobacteria bacterium]